MLSAPHIMPAMIVVSFPAGFTAPEATRVLGRSTYSPINRERPVCSSQFQHRNQTPGRHQVQLVEHGGLGAERVR